MRAVVLVSCGYEWRAVVELFRGAVLHPQPFGEFFETEYGVLCQGGWGKISAAASAQYAIDRWAPPLVVNIGTCGGFQGEVSRGEIILAERTLVYDIVEQMTDPEAAIARYTTTLDLSWLPEELPQPVRRTLLVSADRDLAAPEMPLLKARYGAVAGDWESGAIAWVAARNGVRCLILRGVSDLVGEAYGNVQVYVEGCAEVMRSLVEHLPAWIRAGRASAPRSETRLTTGS